MQLELTWGGRADTAAPLRARCAVGFVQVGARNALDELAILLADPESDARLAAARALGACGALATPLLRFKVLTGDDRPLVVAECLSGLMAAAPEDSWDFVTALVDPGCPILGEHAAMALGESRLPGAYDLPIRAHSALTARGALTAPGTEGPSSPPRMESARRSRYAVPPSAGDAPASGSQASVAAGRPSASRRDMDGSQRTAARPARCRSR